MHMYESYVILGATVAFEGTIFHEKSHKTSKRFKMRMSILEKGRKNLVISAVKKS